MYKKTCIYIIPFKKELHLLFLSGTIIIQSVWWISYYSLHGSIFTKYNLVAYTTVFTQFRSAESESTVYMPTKVDFHF